MVGKWHSYRNLEELRQPQEGMAVAIRREKPAIEPQAQEF